MIFFLLFFMRSSLHFLRFPFYVSLMWVCDAIIKKDFFNDVNNQFPDLMVRRENKLKDFKITKVLKDRRG